MTTSTMTTTMQCHYGMKGIRTKVDGIHTSKMIIGIHTRDKTPPMVDHESSPPSSPLRQPSPLHQPSLSQLPKSSIQSDYIPLRPADNLGIKITGSSQG